MREIKFRVWDKEGQEMYDVAMINWETEEIAYTDHPTGYEADALLEQVELMQYTGLKDKNGKEIYEGDIITGGDGNVPTQILWVDEYGGWGAKNLKRNEIHALDKYFKRFIGEIIGNIHDNPELLEVV